MDMNRQGAEMDLIYEFHYMPVRLKIPQGDEKQDIMEIKGELDLVQLGLDPQEVLGVPLQVFQRDDLDVTHIGHHFLGLGVFLDDEGLVAPFAQGHLVFVPQGIVLDGVVQLQGGQFFIGPKRTGFIKFDKKGEGGGNPVLNGLVHLRGETALGIEIDQQGLLVVGDDDVVDLGGLAPEKTRPRNPEGEKKGEKEDKPPAKEEIFYR
jgi:hypothetical protein